MSRGMKVALILLAIVLFCCCVAGLGVALLGTRLFGRAFITNPERVHAVGAQIADFDTPAGYQEMFAMNMMDTKIVIIAPASYPTNSMMLILAQFPAGMELSQEQKRQLERALARQTGLGNGDMVHTGQEETTIKGEPVTLTVREGVTGQGKQMRQVTASFEGRGGPAILMINGEVDDWDQAMVDEFIASIR
ncbi:MAG: hypothetical protein Kow0063_10000 [Anaerolineae bacterium]